jgi:hypothetical protein
VGGREEAASSQVARVGLRRYGHSGREVITGRIAADTDGTARARQEVEAGMAPVFNALSATAGRHPRERQPCSGRMRLQRLRDPALRHQCKGMAGYPQRSSTQVADVVPAVGLDHLSLTD